MRCLNVGICAHLVWKGLSPWSRGKVWEPGGKPRVMLCNLQSPQGSRRNGRVTLSNSIPPVVCFYRVSGGEHEQPPG